MYHFTRCIILKLVGPFTQNWYTSKCKERKDRIAYITCFSCDIGSGCDPNAEEIQQYNIVVCSRPLEVQLCMVR